MATKNLSESDIVFQSLPKTKSFQNLIGNTYQKLLVIGFAGVVAKRTFWFCKCDCGNMLKVDAASLKRGRTKFCKCVPHANFKHGMLNSREYEAYAGAKKRCQNPKQRTYSYYGGRGIEFRFTSFEQFLAEVGMKPTPEYSIDRIDTDGHYEPGNVRWASATEQVNNKRCNIQVTIDGETKTLAQWCGPGASVFYKMVQKRIRRGWCSHCAIITPSGVNRPTHCNHT